MTKIERGCKYEKLRRWPIDVGKSAISGRSWLNHGKSPPPQEVLFRDIIATQGSLLLFINSMGVIKNKRMTVEVRKVARGALISQRLNRTEQGRKQSAPST